MPDKHKQSEVSAPLWYVSYADLVTNMLCFFVMLFAFSTLDSPKKRQESSSRDEKFYTVFSINQSQGASQWLTEGNKGILLMPSSKKSDLPAIAKKVKSKLARATIERNLSVQSNDQMVRIQIPAKVLFESGSASLKRESEEVLTALVPIVANIDNFIRIDGHTDDVPALNNKLYPTNWELSTARACAVVRFFTEKMQLDPERFSAQGYSEHRPTVKNDTPANREKNRRIEIIILLGKKKGIKEFRWE